MTSCNPVRPLNVASRKHVGVEVGSTAHHALIEVSLQATAIATSQDDVLRLDFTHEYVACTYTLHFCAQGDARVIRCLEESREQLTTDCRVAMFDHMTRMSEDIDFNKPLKDACSSEIKQNCANVNPGHSRVVRCLQDGKRKKYSDKCKKVRSSSIVVSCFLHARNMSSGQLLRCK